MSDSECSLLDRLVVLFVEPDSIYKRMGRIGCSKHNMKQQTERKEHAEMGTTERHEADRAGRVPEGHE
jgi:hypothetical protein